MLEPKPTAASSDLQDVSRQHASMVTQRRAMYSRARCSLTSPTHRRANDDDEEEAPPLPPPPPRRSGTAAALCPLSLHSPRLSSSSARSSISMGGRRVQMQRSSGPERARRGADVRCLEREREREEQGVRGN